MALSILDACACAGKCVSPIFNTIDPTGCGVDAPGLVKHWSVTFDVQFRIMAVVLETGSASMEELVAVLPGHPAPVEAVMAMVEAGMLVSEPGQITPHTRIGLPSRIPVGGAGGGTPSGDGDAATQAVSKIVQLRSSVSHIGAIGFVPELFMLDVADRTDLPSEIDGPIIYFAQDGKEVYFGKSRRGRYRVLAPHINAFERLAIIRDASGRMTERQAGIAERIAYLTLAGLPGYELDQSTPHGERCEFWEYLQIRFFVSQALCLAKEAGFAFADVPVLPLIVGAEGDPGRLAAQCPGQDGSVAYHLYASGINATASEYEGEWIVHAGSEVRARATPSGSAVVNNLRHEWLLSGILVEDGDRFRLTEAVSFSSGSGAANFVLGSKGPNLSAWTRQDPDERTWLSLAV